MDEDLKQRISRKAYALWEANGRPDGQAERHWDEAKEIVALEDVGEPTLKLEDSLGTPVEPAVAFENQGDVPGLDDQGEGRAGPSRDAIDGAAPLPLDTDLAR